MPIYKATDQLNPTNIFVGTQPLQRVYVGVKLVWQKVTAPVITPVKYGLLYNWYAATDEKLIAADGWEVPTQANYQTLHTYLGESPAAGSAMKEIGLTHWIEPNTDATNTSKFNLRGACGRSSLGTWTSTMGDIGLMLTITEHSAPNLYYFYYSRTSGTISSYNGSKKAGQSIRLIKTTTSLSDGESGTYIGNDGKVYRTICIGTQEWLADNLCETKFRDGSYIPGFDGGTYTPFTNEAWAALTTPGVCAYNNDLNNVLIAS